MPASAPAVTVGLPVFNGVAFLADALDSILGQSFSDFELLVADNASTDATRELCENVATRDDRVRVLPSDVNRGLAWNWNRLVAASRAPLFKWACHDDVLHPDLLARSVAMLREAPDHIALVYAQTVDIDEEGHEIGRYPDGLDLREATASARLAHLLGNLARCNPLFGVMRMDHLRRTGLMGAFGHADQVLLAQLALGGQWWEIPEPLFYRRVHPGMSLNIFPEPSQLAKLYDTASSGRYFFPYTRVFLEHARSIANGPLTSSEKARCWAVLMRSWRYYRTIGGEGKRALAQAMRRP